MTPRTPTLMALGALLLTAGAANARTRLDGELLVVNARHHAASIRIDGRSVGSVSPRDQRIYRHVPNGVRIVRIATHRAPDEAREIRVPVRGRAVVKIEPRMGTGAIVNDSGVQMHVEVDGHRVGAVAPGRTLETRRLEPGEHVAVARPAGHGRDAWPLKVSFDVRPGRETRVRLGAWFARLTVRNPLDHAVAVVIDGRRAGRIRPRGRIELDRTAPGRRTVEIRHHREVVARDTLTIRPGERERWSPRAPRGDVLVRNQSRQPVTVSIGGREVACVAPGAAERVRDLPAGEQVLAVRYDRGRNHGRTVRHRVDIRAGATARLVLDPGGRHHGRHGRRGDRYASRH